MNKEIREELETITERLGFLAGGEREKAHKMDECLPGSEKQERLEEIADYLDEAIEQIRGAVE